MLCRPLEAFRSSDVALAGGKGANLGELVAAGFPVPPGFVVTTDAYRAATEGLDDRAADAAAEMPADVAAAIATAYRDLSEGAVAVRSSATAEDLPGAAFAGQQETYLNVVGVDQVLDAVRDCWASLWSERARAYRGRLGIDERSVAIAVVVQRLVAAEHAGVLFTADPVTGDRSQVVIDSSPGLGEAVVSGEVTPDHAVVDAAGSVVERRPGGAEYAVVADEAGGVRRATGLPPDPLPTGQLRQLADIGRRIAAHFGSPQDIEWALHDGELSILQARPMTALPPPVRALTAAQRSYGSMLVELLPRRPLPLELTGWILPIMGPFVTVLYDGLAGLRVDLTSALVTDDAVLTELIPPAPRPTTRTPARLVGLVARAWRHRGDRWTDDPRYRRYRNGVDSLDAEQMREMSWPDLLAVHRQLRHLALLLTELRVEHLPATGVPISQLTALLGALGRTREIPNLWTGGESLTRQADDRLAALAEQIRNDTTLHEVFAATDPEGLVTFVDTDPRAAALRAGLIDLLSHVGHRESTSLLLPADPTWGAAPAVVLGHLRLLATAPSSPEARVADAALDRLARHQVVRRLHLLPTLRRLARRSAVGYAVREDTHVESTRLLRPMRDLALEVGDRLAGGGWIDAVDDVWYLTWDEIIAADPDADSDGDYRPVVEARRGRIEAMTGAPLVNSLSLHTGSTPDDALCAGTPGGGGQATGPVRVVRSVDEFDRLRPGDVLVCTATNPSWTPLFLRAAAVVVDHGGLASHAAIVAREYGIPAVMGTGDGTAVLREGQCVVVDGDSGVVRADD